MSEQIDWSKAPEGATHYVNGSICPFEKRDGDDWYYWKEKSSVWINIYNVCGEERIKKSTMQMIERPSPSWSGEGLPPVGVVCEYRCVNDKWRQVKVIAHMIEMQKDNPCDVSQLGDTGPLCIGGASSFRPIRTPEQIESDARIKAAQEWLKSIGLEYGEDVADQCENILMAAEEKRMDKL